MIGKEKMEELRQQRRATKHTIPLKQALVALLYRETTLNQSSIAAVMGYNFHEMARYSQNQFYLRFEGGWEEYISTWNYICDRFEMATAETEVAI